MKTLLKTILLVAFSSAPLFGQVIQAGKPIKISILGVPLDEKGRVDGDYRVADNGTINMPFIGAVNAAGMKPEALATVLEARYRGAEIYRNPTFQVVSDVMGAQLDEALVVLGGQIAKPGPVKYQPGLTLWQAIQMGGGPTPFGTIKRIKVTRGGQQRQYDLTVIRNMDIQLEPNDGIEIPQKRPWETK
jgi:protein involved in polysaccharide export with SLBB domain